MEQMTTLERVGKELDTVSALMRAIDRIEPPPGYYGTDAIAAHVARSHLYTFTEGQKVRRYAYAKLIRYQDIDTGVIEELRVTSADLTFGDLKIVRRNHELLRELLPAREGDDVSLLLPGGRRRDVVVLEVRFLDRHDPVHGHYDDFLALRDAGTIVARDLRRWIDTQQDGEDQQAPQRIVQDERENRLRDTFYWSPTRAQEEAMRGFPRGLVVVLGVAGSGKTSTALGRMAMLHLTHEGEDKPAFIPGSGLGVVLNESLVGYLKRAMGGQLGLEGMPVLAYTALQRKLVDRRDLLAKSGSGSQGIRRQRVGAAAEQALSSLAWYGAFAAPLAERILATLLSQLGVLPPQWTPGPTRPLNEAERQAESEGKPVSTEAERTEPPLPPADFKDEVLFAQRRAIVPIWAELRRRLGALLKQFGTERTSDARGLVRRVDEVREWLAETLEQNDAWSGSKLKNARRSVRNAVKYRFQVAFQFGERYLELLGDPASRSKLLAVVSVKDGSVVGEALARHWSRRALCDCEIDSLLLFAETAADGYRGRDGAEALSELEEGPRYSHMFIDEFQDFTEAQFALLEKLAATSTSTVFAVGDYHQRLNRAGLTTGFARARQTLFLGENKRQTAPLGSFTADFRVQIQGETQDVTAASSQPGDERPTVLGTDPEALDSALVEAIVGARAAGLSVAVVFADAARAAEVHGRLRDELEAEDAPARLSADVDAANLCDTTFVHFTTPRPVKGLEFDAVFVVDVDSYDLADAVARDELYVALTRARRRLGLAWRHTLDPRLEAIFERHCGALDATAGR